MGDRLMAKPNKNKWAIDYDRMGFCAICHDTVMIFEGFNDEGMPHSGVDGHGKPRPVMFKPNHRVAQFLIQDDSLMPVTMCKICFESFGPKDCGKILESVLNGFQWEIQHGLRKWGASSQDQRHAYMKRYIDTFIVTRMDIIWSDVVDKKITRPLWKNLKAIPWDGSRDNHGRIPPWAKKRDSAQKGWVDDVDKEFYKATPDDPMWGNFILRNLNGGFHWSGIAAFLEKTRKVPLHSITSRDQLVSLAKKHGGDPTKKEIVSFTKKKKKSNGNGQ